MAEGTTTGRPWLVDTTLRDGEQTAGASFSTADAVRLARALAHIGVPELEIGRPGMEPVEIEKMQRVVSENLGCRTTAWCRAREDDVGATARSRVSAVHLSLPVSSIHLAALGKNVSWGFTQATSPVTLARCHFDYVSVGAQDASRTDEPSLAELAAAVTSEGAHRFRLADMVGVWDTIRCFWLVRGIRHGRGTTKLEVHTHDDLGMATANAIAVATAAGRPVWDSRRTRRRSSARFGSGIWDGDTTMYRVGGGARRPDDEFPGLRPSLGLAPMLRRTFTRQHQSDESRFPVTLSLTNPPNRQDHHHEANRNLR